jgi:type I site-specific restriction-modification system R (restriction) subunit
MSDNLRTRIAEVAWERILYWQKEEGYIVDGITGEDIADAVIEALGIYEDEMGTGATRRTRIMSDWEKP